MRLFEANFIVFLVCLELLGTGSMASAGGQIGCLFNKSLCEEKTERCFDDYVFGKCVSYKVVSDKDFHRYHRLDGDSLRLLRRELSKLQSLGYRWSHSYTQCVLKNVLFAVRYQEKYDENKCKALNENDYVLSYYEGNQEELDPKSVGQVQFTPSVVDPYPEFADEIYIPILEEERVLNDGIIPLEGTRSRTEDNHVKDLRRFFLLDKINRDNKVALNEDGDGYFENYSQSIMDNDVVPGNSMSYLNEIPRRENDETIEIYDDFLPKNPFDSRGNAGEAEAGELLGNIFENDRNMLKSFSRNYNTPEKFRDGHETKDEIVYTKPDPPQSNQPVQSLYSPEERRLVYDTFNVFKSEEGRRNEDIDKGVFTEGGVVFLNDGKKGNLPDIFSKEGDNYGTLGFKRPERLDVKKPGPALSTVNEDSSVKETKLEGSKNKKEEKVRESSNASSKNTHSMNLLAQPEKKKGGSPMESPSLRRQTTTAQPYKEKDLDDIKDFDYVFVTFKDSITDWQEGSRIVRKIENLLGLRQNTFINIRVDQNTIKFRVEPNRLNINNAEAAKKIEYLRDPLERTMGVELITTGTGMYQNEFPSTSLLMVDQRQLWVLTFLLCGFLAALIIITIVFLILKKHSGAMDKLEDLAQIDSEASKDYQELCRARMASKTAQEKPEGNTAAYKMSKESDGSNQSPSSRSSTFSWSEEPALTNMDISTGHMVLSYMEDHLKNKERLDQEWIALCAYKAEPCETTIALKEENVKKNRYKDVVPYDHSRVVLNELSNVNGSDYINASTITDHDPRNPAYIACQGPLEHTTADFWQMVWEQGSVVMVMLTRLTENDTVLCHRYWPEEGSELYHIYEVHLVSEHIWCDEYLVRSFYLKNIKTGETRTVTQFHFLSWPENGVPLSTKALLKFRRKVNKSYRGRSCPVVVHCSDGVSRTGTYCLIDMVLNRMAKGAKEIDIAATLEHIRDQRPSMVKTKQQFEFVLMAVAEEVHAILKALPASLNHSPPPATKEKK